MTKPGTVSVGRRAAENVLHGVRFAAERGQPINTLVTISFDSLEIEDGAADAVFKDVRSRVLRAWRHLQSKGRVEEPIFGAYCHANPAGSRHVHWMTHVCPNGFEMFDISVAKFLKKVTGRDELGDALDIRRVARAGSVAKYVLRGIDPAYAAYLHIEPANEGYVVGRRTGVSRAISKSARKSSGWVRKRSGRGQAPL